MTERIVNLSDYRNQRSVEESNREVSKKELAPRLQALAKTLITKLSKSPEFSDALVKTYLRQEFDEAVPIAFSKGGFKYLVCITNYVDRSQSVFLEKRKPLLPIERLDLQVDPTDLDECSLSYKTYNKQRVETSEEYDTQKALKKATEIINNF